MKKFKVLAALCCCLGLLQATPKPSSFAYVLQAEALDPQKAEAGKKLAQCERDWIVLDTHFSADQAWQPQDLELIRQAHQHRKILAYISIGEAEDYRDYWQERWLVAGKPSAQAPVWLLAQNPHWKGNYRVSYWHKDWQDLVLERVDAAMQAGFDGIYLDIVDAFQSYEQQGKIYLADALNPLTTQTYRRDMVDFVKLLAARARSANAEALVVPQNASQLLVHEDFLQCISAIGIEDLFSINNRLQKSWHTLEVLDNLQYIQAGDKPVLLIEYAKRAKRKELCKAQARHNGLLWLLTDRPLKTLGESGN